jgi:dynein heavy chain
LNIAPKCASYIDLDEDIREDVHPNFICFLSSEPPSLPDMKIIPESILQNLTKAANESP